MQYNKVNSGKKSTAKSSIRVTQKKHTTTITPVKTMSIAKKKTIIPSTTPVKKNKSKNITAVVTTNIERSQQFWNNVHKPGFRDATPELDAKMAFLTFSHLNGTSRFQDLIFPALDLWHPTDEPLFIILAQQWEPTYRRLFENDETFSHYKDRIHPVFVDCPEGKTYQSECCKQEKGMLYMFDHYKDVYEWIIYLDDDNYIRTEFMRRYLNSLPTDEHFVLTGGPSPRFLGIFGYLPQQAPYKCARNPQYKYAWGQVAIYNRATLALMERGLRLGGLTRQCAEYRVFHDVGNAILHWMYQLPELHVEISDRPNEVRPSLMGSHGVGRCPRKPPSYCNMKRVHDSLSFIYFQPPKGNFTHEWRNFTRGFATTTTFQMHGSPADWTDVWHTMPIKDCLGPLADKK